MKKRILLADPSKEQIREILHAAESSHYKFETAVTGSECLKKIEEFQPDLVFLDLLLPQVHGIEVMKQVKSKSEKKIGFIIASAQAMIQNFRSALHAGADYFIEKPFAADHLFEIFGRFFDGTLTPPAFSGKDSTTGSSSKSYQPKCHVHENYIKFWGTRGSNPVAGQEYIRYGGNTCCLEVHQDGDLVIIDAGTGIRALGDTPIFSKKKMIHLILGHTHWDHIIGFPFFAPIYNSDHQLTIWSPIGFEKTTKELFTEMLTYAYFPVRLDDIRAKLIFKEIQEGVPFSIGNIQVNSHYAYHPGATLCFKVQAAGKTFGYVTDNEMLMGYQGNPNEIIKGHPLLEPHLSMIHFFKECDFLVHEAQYFPQEYREKVGWGHSSISNASVLIKQSGVKEWIVTHHDPAHSDEDLHRKRQCHQDILDEGKVPCRVRFAFDGLTLPL